MIYSTISVTWVPYGLIAGRRGAAEESDKGVSLSFVFTYCLVFFLLCVTDTALDLLVNILLLSLSLSLSISICFVSLQLCATHDVRPHLRLFPNLQLVPAV
jgi:threonine/homoserine efflux transporter RhtA